MPNYGLVVTPTYNPMSYEQYIQPFKDYAQVYNATVDQIDALEMEANQWERLADSDIDAPQYQQYKSYADDLRKYANEIATQGLSSRTRAGLSRMRQRYAKEIKPIEDAFNRRQEAIKAEDALLAKDPSLVLANSARNIGLSQYMSGTPQTYGVSGNDVYAKTMAAFKAISGRDIDFRELRRFGNTYLGLQKVTGEENPAGMLEALNAIKDNPEYVPDSIKQIIANTGDPDAFYQYAQALTNVLGSTNYDKLTSEGKNRIMQSALLGGNTGMIFDIDEKDYQDWYLQHRLNNSDETPGPLGTLIAQPSTIESTPTVTVNESRDSFNKEADKIIKDMENRELVITKNSPQRPGESALIGIYNPGETTRSKYYKDLPKREEFANTGDYYKAVIKSIDNNIKSWEKVKDHPRKDEVLGNLKRDKIKLEKAISNYKEKLSPYSRVFSFNPDNFVDDQTASAISAIQQGYSKIAHNEFALNYQDAKYNEEAKSVLSKRLDMVNLDEDNKNMGVFLIKDNKGKLEKVTDSTTIDSLKKGTLAYDTNLGILININGQRYIIKDGGVFDKIKRVGNKIIKASAFNDEIYNKDFDKSKRIVTREDNIYTEEDLVYKDSDINIYEYRTKDGDVHRKITDKRGDVISDTSIGDIVSNQKNITHYLNEYVLNKLIDWSAANVTTR